MASYLNWHEKMNVVVEPDVHDMFARIPGFGFVQTFYNEDTRYWSFELEYNNLTVFSDIVAH